MKTSGYLNESAGKAPKILYVESKEALSERQALIRASKKYKGMYGAEIRVADVEQISESMWDAVKGFGSGVMNMGKGLKNNYIEGRNKSRMNSIVKNIIKSINDDIAPLVQDSDKFGGFTQEQLQQVKTTIDNVMNAATVAQQPAQPQAGQPQAGQAETGQPQADKQPVQPQTGQSNPPANVNGKNASKNTGNVSNKLLKSISKLSPEQKSTLIDILSKG